MKLLYNEKIRVAIGLINPFIIKSQNNIINKLPLPITLIDKATIGSALLLRFAISPQKCLGNTIGQYIQISSQQKPQIKRPFYPISPINMLGCIDFLFKPVPQGSLSKIIEKSTLGNKFIISEPNSFYKYNGYGNFTIDNQQFKYDKIGIICSGSNISSFCQLILGIKTNNDQTPISIIYVSQNSKDFYLAHQLIDITQSCKNISITFMLNGKDDLWPGLRGIPTMQQIERFMPKGNNSIILCAASLSIRKWASQNIQNTKVVQV